MLTDVQTPIPRVLLSSPFNKVHLPSVTRAHRRVALGQSRRGREPTLIKRAGQSGSCHPRWRLQHHTWCTGSALARVRTRRSKRPPIKRFARRQPVSFINTCFLLIIYVYVGISVFENMFMPAAGRCLPRKDSSRKRRRVGVGRQAFRAPSQGG